MYAASELMSRLPRVCYAVHPTDEVRVIFLKRGHQGYWDHLVLASPEDAKAFVNRTNAMLGVSPVQAEAMNNGSMCGFDKPGADPLWLQRDDVVAAGAETATEPAPRERERSYA